MAIRIEFEITLKRLLGARYMENTDHKKKAFLSLNNFCHFAFMPTTILSCYFSGGMVYRIHTTHRMTGTVPTGVQDTHHPLDDRYSTDWCTGYTPPTGWQIQYKLVYRIHTTHRMTVTLKNGAKNTRHPQDDRYSTD
jgi:hypothetical protein